MEDPRPADARSAEHLNEACLCVGVEGRKLRQTLNRTMGEAGFGQALAARHPWLFSHSPVFLQADLLKRMLEVVEAVEAAATLAGYRAATMAWAPEHARPDPGPAGAFMGYDFHLTDDGPKLIEINTNAGGGFLNAVLAQAQHACCSEDLRDRSQAPAATFAPRVAAMFVQEWRRQGRSGPLQRIAIVDDDPPAQPLHGEFRIAERLLTAAGFGVVIADPQDLAVEAGRLVCRGEPVDLVYNRLVDFWLEQPAHAVLRRAYDEGAVVLTPNPHVYALLADKRNLTLLCDDERLAGWGLPPAQRDALRQAVPETVRLTADNAERLWRTRNRWFFKPARGHASRAAYRGDKLTQRVWGEILAGDYVAQAIARPSERRVLRDGEAVRLKVDVRLYTYAGAILLAAARLYQGQTTNMRTPGGGFAPLVVMRSQAP